MTTTAARSMGPVAGVLLMLAFLATATAAGAKPHRPHDTTPGPTEPSTVRPSRRTPSTPPTTRARTGQSVSTSPPATVLGPLVTAPPYVFTTTVPPTTTTTTLPPVTPVVVDPPPGPHLSGWDWTAGLGLAVVAVGSFGLAWRLR